MPASHIDQGKLGQIVKKYRRVTGIKIAKTRPEIIPSCHEAKATGIKNRIGNWIAGPVR
jgi:molybdenum cofactor biosynthesis enzyme